MQESLQKNDDTGESTKISKITDPAYLLQKWELSLELVVQNRYHYADTLIAYQKELAKQIDISYEKSIDQIKGLPEILHLKKKLLGFETAIRAGELKIKLLEAKYESIKTR